MKQLLQNKKQLISLIFLTVIMAVQAQDGPSSYYKTNPTFGKRVANPITIDGNPTEWDSDMLIVQGVANDDARAFRGSHEGPVYDLYQLYAAWDNSNLYLMWQLTNVSDIASPAQDFPQSDNGKPWNGDIPFQLAFDIDQSSGTNGLITGKEEMGVADSHVWGIYNVFPNENVDKLLMFSAKPGVGQPAIFTPDAVSGRFDYKPANITSFSDAGIVYQWGDYCLPTQIFGIPKDGHSGYVTSDLSNESAYVDFIALGHNKDMNTVYEMKIPLTALGIDASYIETTGIGVMLISTFGQSGVNSLPFDSTTIDNASEEYGPDDSTSKEKEDIDMFTVPFARIGIEEGTPNERPAISVIPTSGTYIGGTNVTVTATGDNQPIIIHYTLDGTTPTSSSPTIMSGNSINITANNTVLKAVAIDANNTSSLVTTNTYITEETIVSSGITVSFLKPEEWGTSTVNIWAWNADGNIFTAWPGVEMNVNNENWYSYTFDEEISEVNVIFSKNGNPQTIDITNISSNKCYKVNGTLDGKINVQNVPCPVITSLSKTTIAQSIQIYPNPATNSIKVKGVTKVGNSIAILSMDGKTVKLLHNYLDNEEIELSNISNGVYILKITDDNGKVDFIKFIKR